MFINIFKKDPFTNYINISDNIRNLLDKAHKDKSFAEETGLCNERIHLYNFAMIIGTIHCAIEPPLPVALLFNNILREILIIPMNRSMNKPIGKCVHLQQSDIINIYKSYDDFYRRLSYDSVALASEKFNVWADDKTLSNYFDGCIDFQFSREISSSEIFSYNVLNADYDDFKLFIDSVYGYLFSGNDLSDIFPGYINMERSELKDMIIPIIKRLSPAFKRIFGTPVISAEHRDIIDLISDTFTMINSTRNSIIYDLLDSISADFNVDKQKYTSKNPVLAFFTALDIDEKTDFINLLICVSCLDKKVTGYEIIMICKYFDIWSSIKQSFRNPDEQ